MVSKRFTGYLRRRAWKETAESLGLGDAAGIVIRVLLLCGYLLVVWWLTNRAEAESEAWLRIAAIVPPVAAFPIMYFWKRSSIQMEMIERTTRQLQKQRSTRQPGPRLQIWVVSKAYGGKSPDFPGNRSLAFVLEVRNLGDRATAAINWTCTIRLPTGAPTFIPYIVQSITLGMDASSNQITFEREEAIPYKTYEPIPDGGVISGLFLTFIPEDIYYQIGDGTEFVISCEQVDGTIVSLVHTHGSGIASRMMATTPGVKFSLEEGEVP